MENEINDMKTVPPVEIKDQSKLLKNVFKMQWRDCCDCIHGHDHLSLDDVIRTRCDECFDDPGHPDFVLKAQETSENTDDKEKEVVFKTITIDIEDDMYEKLLVLSKKLIVEDKQELINYIVNLVIRNYLDSDKNNDFVPPEKQEWVINKKQELIDYIIGATADYFKKGDVK